MKKNFIILLVTACLTTACGDSFLDKGPSDKITTDEAITTLNDVKVAVDGLYSLMADTYYYNASMFLYGDVKGDDMQATSWSSGRTSYTYYTYEHSATAPNSGGLWGRPYYTVRNAYNVISAIDNGEVNASQKDLENYKGQALAIVALCHFDLLRLYGYPYAKDNGASWGVPIVDHAIGYDEFPERNTVAECYDFIIKQLNDAIPLLASAKNDGHINAYAARALLARVYLYCERNKEAFEIADQLIKDCEASGLYSLASHDNYLSQFDFSNKFGSEALFQIANTPSNNPGRNGLSYLLHWWGYAAVALTEDFAHFMQQDQNDIRNGLIASYQNSSDGLYYDFLLKYPGEKAYNIPSFENNYTVLRLSEVYLIAAEAGQKQGGQVAIQALAYLNRIVQRGNPNNWVEIADFSLDRVLDERRKELVGEGHRFFDMLRNGKTMYRSGGKHLMNTPAEVNWDYYKCILPIDREQFTFNPDMPQNPGYARE
ncbi:MAG: RagB/SusD family nutrient uptake outer membrane protein [Bacteroides sp.]|nr:RagB/SusD family nutrient uptake outer membrane protein [Bacteroides sp.]